MIFTLQQSSTIGTALRQATGFLKDHGVAEPGLAAEWIFSHELRCARLELALRPDEPLSPESCRMIPDRINRVAAGEPLQYVLGTAEFMGRVFQVDPRCLVPRPETELLTETILGCAPLWAIPQPVIADVGTGSGCIVITLALTRPAGRFQAIDIAADTLDLARDNAIRHGVHDRIQFFQGHLLSPLLPNSLDAVVANLPYIRTGDWARLPAMIRDHEPRAALDGGHDGLEMIRPLTTQAARTLKPGGWLFLEIGEEQGTAVQQLLKENGFAGAEAGRDFSGKERFMAARRPAKDGM